MVRMLTHSLVHTVGKVALAIILINMLYRYIHGEPFDWQRLLDLEALPDKLVTVAGAVWEWGVAAVERYFPSQARGFGGGDGVAV
ncbi:MAG: hypothetical protein GKR89_15765 [Candidatus Latescibacteria bacterium]|nr:hypothetical protein [Candidatus Latescibacterota bacterium]